MRVLEALLTLVEEGELRPTAQIVAQRAGVALRTVYHHFEDVEALRRMALDLQLTRHRESLKHIDPSLPIEERITVFSRQCRRLFEAVTPIRRATLFDENSSPEMAEGLRNSRTFRRAHLEASFPDVFGKPGSARELLDAADVASSWNTWYYLRHSLGRSAQSAEGTIVLTLGRVLTEAGKRRK